MSRRQAQHFVQRLTRSIPPRRSRGRGTYVTGNGHRVCWRFFVACFWSCRASTVSTFTEYRSACRVLRALARS